MSGWTPVAPTGQTPNDLPLREWIGQAIGAASGCWVGGTGDLEFDSAKAKEIYESLHERLLAVVGGPEPSREVRVHFITHQGDRESITTKVDGFPHDFGVMGIGNIRKVGVSRA